MTRKRISNMKTKTSKRRKNAKKYIPCYGVRSYALLNTVCGGFDSLTPQPCCPRPYPRKPSRDPPMRDAVLLFYTLRYTDDRYIVVTYDALYRGST
jgi:hypothetical protein